ncbi:MAG: ParB/RepB/Spo0J family partition protein, partial [Candidatus Paceibacterota bacterium]
NLKHAEVAKKVGKSREYVSNSLRILALPQDILDALVARKISEGHTRPLLMLAEKPDEQLTLFQEIVVRRLTVREAEQTARRIAVGKVRTKDYQVDPNIIEAEERLSERLGAKVRVEKREKGGRLTISFVSPEDLHKIFRLLNEDKVNKETAQEVETFGATNEPMTEQMLEDLPEAEVSAIEEESDEDLYSVRNFSL